MSLYGSLFSGVTGLNAQSLALGVISENITNVNTTGFKARTTSFATMVSGDGIEAGSVGGVLHNVSKQVDGQGIIQATTNATDLAISGGGFFVVNSNVDNGRAVGDTMFTRAGNFAIDEDRQLANAAGHFLMGWKLNTSGEFVDSANNQITPDPTSAADLVPVDLSDVTFSSQATEEVEIKATFPAQMVVSDAFDVSVSVFDGLGSTHDLDFTFTKSDHVVLTGNFDAAGPINLTVETPAKVGEDATTDATEIDLEMTFAGVDPDDTDINLWNVKVIPNTGSATAGDPLNETDLDTFQLRFDSDDKLIGDPIRQVDVSWAGGLGAEDSIIALDFASMTFDAGAAAAATHTVNNSGALLKMDVGTTNEGDTFVGDSANGTFVKFDGDGNLVSPDSFGMEIDWNNVESFADNSTISLDLTNLGAVGDTFQLSSTNQDGVAFGAFTGVTVSDEGFVVANFKNGTFLPVYRLPLADFNNPNGLKELPGNAYISTLESGNFFLSQSGEGSVGDIIPQSLEQSTVDIAREFANMIITQRAFSSASTVITTADEMLQELVQIKR